MNLYKVTMTHYAPNGSDSATAGFVYAEDDADVFDKTEHMLSFDREEIKERDCDWLEPDQDPVEWYKNEIITNQSDWSDEWGDFYYGHTAYSWESVAENVGPDEARAQALASVGMML